MIAIFKKLKIQFIQKIHFFSGERLLRERLEREGEPLPEELETLDNLSPEEKKAYEAERRVAWRKARLKSLENVRF